MPAAKLSTAGDQETVHIAVLNESTAISNADIRAMLVGLHHQWNVDLQPIW